jgi:AraC-like DNA-binding protein
MFAMTLSEAIMYGYADQVNDQIRSLIERGIETQVELEDRIEKAKIQLVSVTEQMNKVMQDGIAYKKAVARWEDRGWDWYQKKDSVDFREYDQNSYSWCRQMWNRLSPYANYLSNEIEYCTDRLSTIQNPERNEKPDTDTHNPIKWTDEEEEPSYNSVHWDGCRQKAQALDIELDRMIPIATTEWLFKFNTKLRILRFGKKKTICRNGKKINITQIGRQLSYRDYLNLRLRVQTELAKRLPENKKILADRDKLEKLVADLKPVKSYEYTVDPNVDLSGRVRLMEDRIIEKIDLCGYQDPEDAWFEFALKEDRENELPVTKVDGILTLDAYVSCDGNKSAAARLLKMPRTTFRRQFDKVVELAKTA